MWILRHPTLFHISLPILIIKSYSSYDGARNEMVFPKLPQIEIELRIPNCIHQNQAAAVWDDAGSITVSTSIFGIDALVPPRFVDRAFGFLV